MRSLAFSALVNQHHNYLFLFDFFAFYETLPACTSAR